MLKIILQQYNNFKFNESASGGQSEDKTSLNNLENQNQKDSKSTEAGITVEISQAERIKLIQELEDVKNRLYNGSSSVRFQEDKLNKMEYAKRKIESVENLITALSGNKFELGFDRNRFYVSDSVESKKIKQLEADLDSEKALEALNPDITKLKQEVQNEEAKKTFLSFGGPDTSKIYSLNSKIEIAKADARKIIRTSIKDLQPIIQSHKEVASQLTDQYEMIPEEFKWEMNRGVFTIQDFRDKLQKNIQEVNTYEPSEFLESDLDKLEELRAREKVLKASLSK
jgi:hypothetical protein